MTPVITYCISFKIRCHDVYYELIINNNGIHDLGGVTKVDILFVHSNWNMTGIFICHTNDFYNTLLVPVLTYLVLQMLLEG